MNVRLVVVPAIAILAAGVIWLSRGPSVPAATWRTGADGRQPRNYEELPAGTPVTLSFWCDEARFVYVFTHNREDGTLLLFPSPDVRSDLAQPVPPGHHVLPGARDGKELAWHTRHEISATTTWMVVASKQAVPELDALLPKLRRWTNTALTSGAMDVTNPPAGVEVAAGPGKPLPDPLLLRAADAADTATVVNGPLEPDAVREGVWVGSWRTKEDRAKK